MPKIKSLTDRIKDKALLAEIGRRRITKSLAETYLEQAFILPNRLNAFAFRNDLGGHVVYHRNAETYQERETTIGPTGIRTIPADPKAAHVAVFVFVHFWDFLTHVHICGKPKPDQMHIITNGQVREAVTCAREETRLTKIVYQSAGDLSEYEFMSQLNTDAPALVGFYEHLSDAFMADPLVVTRNLGAPELKYSLTESASVTMRLKPDGP